MAEPRGLEAMMPDRPRLLTVEEIDALVPLLSPTERQDLVGCHHDNPCECEPTYRSVTVRRVLGPHYRSLLRMARAVAWMEQADLSVCYDGPGRWMTSCDNIESNPVTVIESAEEASRG